MNPRSPFLFGLVLTLAACEEGTAADDVAELDDLSSRITALEMRAADAESRASDAEARLAALETRAAEAETRLAEAEADLASLTSSTAASDAALDGRVTTLEASSSDHDVRIATLETWGAETETRLEVLEGAQAALETTTTANDGELQDQIDALEAQIVDVEIDVSDLAGAMDADLADIDDRLSELDEMVSRLNETMTFVGENDASFSIDLGASEESGDVTVDDSAIASLGSVLVGSGSMFGTSFEVPSLDPGVYAITMSVQWGAGINEEAITQRFNLDCSGVEVLYEPRVQIATGDADENGINVAYPITVRAWVRASSGDSLSCALVKRTMDIARTGSGVLYNDLNGPVVATVELVVLE